MSNLKKITPVWSLLGVFGLLFCISTAQAADKCGDSILGHSTGVVSGQCWTKQNLNMNLDQDLTGCTELAGSHTTWDPASGNYADNPRGATNYGKLYTYTAAVAACQALGDEWHVPTSDQWWGLGVSSEIFPGTCSGTNCTYVGDGNSIKGNLNINYFGGNYYDGTGFVYKDDKYNWEFNICWSDTDKNSGVKWAYQVYKEGTPVRRQGMASGVEGYYDMLSVRCVRDLRPLITSLGFTYTDSSGKTQNLQSTGEDTYKSTTQKVKMTWNAPSERATGLEYSQDGGTNWKAYPITELTLTEGLNQFNFQVRHEGHPDEVSEIRSVWINYEAPVTDITPPAVYSAKDVTTNGKPTWTWQSTDENADDTFKYSLDGATPVETTANSFIPENKLSYGEHTLEVWQRFGGDKWSSASSSKTVKIVASLTPDVAVSPASGDYSDPDLEITLTAYTDENKTTKSPDTVIEYAFDATDANWTRYTGPVKVFANVNEGGNTGFYVRLDGGERKDFLYKRVAAGNEDQTLNTHEETERVEKAAKFSLENADVDKLANVWVDDEDDEDEVKLDLSTVTKTESGKKTVTLTGDSEKLQIKRKKSGISVEFDLRGTQLTADDDWNGEVIVPTITDSPSNYGVTDDEELKTIFKVGDMKNEIKINKAARIIIPGQGERKAMYYDQDLGDGQWVDVPVCSILDIDNQDDANSKLSENGHCYAEEGGDMVIYTKHFSFFSTFITNIVANSGDAGSDSSYSISKGVLATVTKFKNMLGGAGQRVMVASGLNLNDVVQVTRDGRRISLEEIMDTASGSAASRTNRLVSFAIGDTISTTSAGALDVDLGGFTKMHIAANSKVTIKEAKNDQIIYSQGDGQIRYDFDKKDTDMSWEVRTKSVNAVIRGTIIDVIVKDGVEIYDLIKGAIDIEDGRTGDSYPLKAGERLMVDQDGNILTGKIGEDLTKEDTSEGADRKYRRPVNFRDVPTGQWFTNPVMALKNNRIIKGYAGNYFKPSQAITRAEALKIVLMANDAEIKTNISASNLLSDVKSGDWFANYVATADEQNIVNGYQDGTFRPGNSITRAEALKIILKTKGVTVSGGERAGNHFSDCDAEDWFASYVVYAYENNMINGYTDGTFRPNAPVTRAEFAKMISDINGIK